MPILSVDIVLGVWLKLYNCCCSNSSSTLFLALASSTSHFSLASSTNLLVSPSSASLLAFASSVNFFSLASSTFFFWSATYFSLSSLPRLIFPPWLIFFDAPLQLGVSFVLTFPLFYHFLTLWCYCRLVPVEANSGICQWSLSSFPLVHVQVPSWQYHGVVSTRLHHKRGYL